MADKKAGGLSLSIGLTLSQLQSDFLAAEQTVKQGIAALNRQQNIIKLRMEADTAGLDAVADKTKIIEVQERSLTQLLDLQRDKLKLATAAYQDVAQSKGANSAAAKQLETSMERERLAVARLEAQLKSLSAQKISVDTSQLQDSISKLNARIQHVKIQADIDTSKLQGANAAFDAQKIHIAAVTKEIELQRQKLAQLQAQMYQSARGSGSDSVQTLNIKSNVLQQIQQINQLETKLKELRATNINLQIRADSLRQAEQSITDNIARINARIEHIRVKTDIDVSKLGAAATEFDKAKAHVAGLNRELTLQNQKLAELRRSLATSVSTNGLNNVKTINLQTDIQRQIQAINQLEAKIKELNNIAPPKPNNLLSGYLNIKGDVTGKLQSITTAFSNLRGATSSADSAITSVLGVIGEIPHPVGRAATALLGLPIIFKGIENSILDMTRAATAAGDATYVMSRGFQMSIKDTGKFSTNAKVAGTDVNSLATAIKQVQRQIVRGGDDSKASEWLKKYGESARDANGNLKDLNEMTFALSRALHKAQAEGKGAEFVFSVFRNISADDITAIEDWIAVNEQAATIVKNGLANPALAHEVKGNLNALAVQEGQLKASFENALLPVANEIIPRVTERMGKLTQILADNKDVIKEIGSDLASIWSGIETVADKIGAGIGAVGSVLKDVYMAQTNARNQLVERYKNDPTVKTAEDLFKKELSRSYLPTERAAIENSPYRYDLELRKYEPIAKAIQDAKEKIKEEKKSLAATMAEGIAGSIFKPFFDKFNQDITPDLQKYRDEVDAILYKMNHTEYENKIYDVEKRYEAALRDGDKTLMEQAELQKLRAAQLAQIQKEQLEKTQQYYTDAADIEYRLTHTAFEKQLRDIEQWKEAKIKAGEDAAAVMANAAAKEAEAFESAMDRIRGTLQSLEDKIFEQEHSQYENDLRRLQQERLRYYEDYQKSGILNDTTQAMIERYYQNAVGKLNQRAAESRAKDSDYTKSPNGGMQRGGNGIVVIGGDKIFDDGLIRGQQQQIGLLADENQIRAQFMQTLPQETRERLAAIEATRQLTDAQKFLTQQTQQAASGFQIIEGDRVVDMPSMPTQAVEHFGDAVQQTANAIEQSDPSKILADAQKSLADNVNALPPDYFQNLADGTKAVSEMQLHLTDSTMHLIDAQDKLAAAIVNLPTANQSRDTNQRQSDNGMMKLNYSTQNLQDAQSRLVATTRDADARLRDISDIPPQSKIAQRDNGIKFGIDYDTFKDVLLTGVGIAGGAATTGIGAGAIPAIAVGTLATAIAAAIGKGTFDATTATPNLPVEADLSQLLAPLTAIDEKTQSIWQAIQDNAQDAQPEINFAELLAPLSNVDAPLSTILQQMQDAQPREDDRLQELFGTLPNIEAGVNDILLDLQARAEQQTADYLTPLNSIDVNLQSVLQALQAPQAEATAIDYLTPITAIDGKLQSVLDVMPRQETISFETVVTPLNNIASIVGNILTALNSRQPPQITVAPNISVNLGGAYVFDNAMKRELVDDCTQQIVDKVEQSVRQATSNSSYGYGA